MIAITSVVDPKLFIYDTVKKIRKDTVYIVINTKSMIVKISSLFLPVSDYLSDPY